jgi:hypothetical protein
VYVRANPSIFDVDATAGSTELDWTNLGENNTYTDSKLYRFWQVKVRLNLEKLIVPISSSSELTVVAIASGYVTKKSIVNSDIILESTGNGV